MIIEFLACLVLGSGDLHDHRDPPIGPLPWRPELDVDRVRVAIEYGRSLDELKQNGRPERAALTCNQKRRSSFDARLQVPVRLCSPSVCTIAPELREISIVPFGPLCLNT